MTQNSPPHKASAPAFDPPASYFAAAQSWADERDTAALRASRRAWLVAAVAIVLALLEALALISLLPLKTIVPYTVLVDRNTGQAQALDPAHGPTISQQGALAQAMLAQYVVARETYDLPSLQENYRKVGLWSAQTARSDYLALMQAGNPASPIARLGRQGQLRAEIASVTLLDAPGAAGQNAPGRALLRFALHQRDASGAQSTGYFLAVVAYRFLGQPEALGDRLANPLGFQVLSYRRDQESAPAPATPAPAYPAPAYLAPAYPATANARPAIPAPLPAAPPTAASTAPSLRPQAPAYIRRYAPWRFPQPAAGQTRAAPQHPQVPNGGEP